MIGAWVNNNVRQHGVTVTHWQGIKTGNPSPHGETTAFSRIFKQSFRDGNHTKPWNMCQTHESATSCTSSKTNKTSADWDFIGRTELTTNHMVFFFPCLLVASFMASQGNAWCSTLIQPRDGMKPFQNRIVRSQVPT